MFKFFTNRTREYIFIFLTATIFVIAFFSKGMSLYIAKVLMIQVSQELKADVQKDMMKSLISTDTKFIDKIHTGKFISNLTLDVTLLVNLISTALLIEKGRHSSIKRIVQHKCGHKYFQKCVKYFS